MSSGPSLRVGTLVGPTNAAAVDFPVRPTIGGNPFTIASPYVQPTLSTSSPTSTGSITISNPQMVTYGTLTNLEFTATTTPTATGTASFLVSLPGRTTNFSALTDARIFIQGKDSNANIVNNLVGFATVSGTTVQINFQVNGASNFASHILDCRVQYTSV